MSLDHSTINCAREGCFAIITLHPKDEQRLRSTHETFYCPAGDSNYFPGKTPQEKQADELKRRVARLGRETETAWTECQYERDVRSATVRGLQVCPLGCGWRSTRRLPWHPDEDEIGRFLDRVGSDFAEHLVGEHNATRAPIALLEAGDPA